MRIDYPIRCASITPFDAHPPTCLMRTLRPVRCAPPYPFGAHRLWCGVRIECLCTWGDFVAYFVATLQKGGQCHVWNAQKGSTSPYGSLTYTLKKRMVRLGGWGKAPKPRPTLRTFRFAFGRVLSEVKPLRWHFVPLPFCQPAAGLGRTTARMRSNHRKDGAEPPQGWSRTTARMKPNHRKDGAEPPQG